MREKILYTASELFLTMGVKSVTMDDIAQQMAISKKTIYEYYKNKTALVKATTHYVFEQIQHKIDSISCDECERTPIHTLFHINDFMIKQFREDNAPEYQLQKYYPKIFKSLKEKRFKIITEGITENLENGIAIGVYRSDIDIPVIARLYYNSIVAIKSSDVFTSGEYKISQLMRIFTLYHIRAIATSKGLQELETILQNDL